jgi:Tol biopolymer transport system component
MPTPPNPDMTVRRNYGIASLLLGILSACGGDSTAPPTTGTLELSIATTGTDIDADGFLLSIDGGSAQVISANGTLSLSKLPGTHSLAVSGLAFNCDVTAPASAEVRLGTTTRVNIAGSCTPYLRNVIVYTSDQFGYAEVMVMRPDGSRNERLTTDQAVYATPVVSPDGQAIAVSSHLGGSWSGIYLLDRFGKGRTKIISGSGVGAPAWSPDGTKIAFVSELPGPYGAYGAATDWKYDSGPSWSPDGNRLVFTRSAEIFLINADGTGLVSTGVQGGYPAWSPDGTLIAYESINGGSDGIFTMDMTFTPRRITTAVTQDEWPRWSPDGHQIVFERLENLAFHIYKMAADGSGATKLSTVPQNESSPYWTRSF